MSRFLTAFRTRNGGETKPQFLTAPCHEYPENPENPERLGNPPLSGRPENAEKQNRPPENPRAGGFSGGAPAQDGIIGRQNMARFQSLTDIRDFRDIRDHREAENAISRTPPAWGAVRRSPHWLRCHACGGRDYWAEVARPYVFGCACCSPREPNHGLVRYEGGGP